jgi:hypothetical protein
MKTLFIATALILSAIPLSAQSPQGDKVDLA